MAAQGREATFWKHILTLLLLNQNIRLSDHEQLKLEAKVSKDSEGRTNKVIFVFPCLLNGEFVSTTIRIKRSSYEIVFHELFLQQKATRSNLKEKMIPALEARLSVTAETLEEIFESIY